MTLKNFLKCITNFKIIFKNAGKKSLTQNIQTYSARFIFSYGRAVVAIVFPPLFSHRCAFRFVVDNVFREEGVNKKLVRVLDTAGSAAALVALVLGLFSVFTDQ